MEKLASIDLMRGMNCLKFKFEFRTYAGSPHSLNP